MSRCFIYARVSPTKREKKSVTIKDKDNKAVALSIEQQIIKCREVSKMDGFDIIREYYDEYVSGKSQYYMSNFKKMINDSKNELSAGDKIYVLRVDRFGRNTTEMLNSINELKTRNISVKFVAMGFETIPSDETPFAQAMSKLMITLLSAVAEWQREEIITRTQIAREKSYNENPEKFGRPKKDIDWENVQKLLKIKDEEGKPEFSWSKIAKMVGVTTATLIRRYKSKFGSVPRRRI